MRQPVGATNTREPAQVDTAPAQRPELAAPHAYYNTFPSFFQEGVCYICVYVWGFASRSYLPDVVWVFRSEPARRFCFSPGRPGGKIILFAAGASVAEPRE